MKIDLKKPINSSLFSILITFVISLIILYTTKPSYIMEVSKNGKNKKNIYLLVVYSILFGISVGIIVLLYMKGLYENNSVKPIMSFNPRSYIHQKIYSPRT